MKTNILLRMEPELKEELKRISKADRRSINSLILAIIDSYISGEEGVENAEQH